MAAEANGDEQSLGTHPSQDGIRVRRHVVRARPSASWLRLRHPRESLRQSRADVPDGSGGEPPPGVLFLPPLPPVPLSSVRPGGLFPLPPPAPVSLRSTNKVSPWAP